MTTSRTRWNMRSRRLDAWIWIDRCQKPRTGAGLRGCDRVACPVYGVQFFNFILFLFNSQRKGVVFVSSVLESLVKKKRFSSRDQLSAWAFGPGAELEFEHRRAVQIKNNHVY